MSKASKNTSLETSTLDVGVYTKARAAQAISQGCRHLHSTELGERDPLVRLTYRAIAQGSVPQYPWEMPANTQEITIHSSKERTQAIQELVARQAEPSTGRSLRETAQSVLEELVSNAMYHAYRNASGQEKYARTDKVELPKAEALEVLCGSSHEGLYICVKDHAGSLGLESVGKALARCYTKVNPIEEKKSGAGLGIYMAFESATHLKVETCLNEKTAVSCWISATRAHNPTTFSFNFFEWRNLR